MFYFKEPVGNLSKKSVCLCAHRGAHAHQEEEEEKKKKKKKKKKRVGNYIKNV